MKHLPLAALLLSMAWSGCTTQQVSEQPIDPTLLNTERIPSSSQVKWRQIGPGNSGISHLVQYHPTVAGHVVLGPDMWTAYQSTNDGKMWQGIKDYDGNGGHFTHLRDVRFSAADADFGLAIESARLWSSTNRGASWEMVKNCPWYNPSPDGTEPSSARKISAVGCDPQDARTYYIGGGAHVRGQQWLSCMSGATAQQPSGSRCDYEGELWRTTDGGKSFELANKGIDPLAQFVRIIVHPTKSNCIYAASQRGVFCSNNGGDSWRNITQGKVDNNVIMDMDSYYDKRSGKFVLYIIDQTQYTPQGNSIESTGGIYYSTNEGESWSEMTGNLYLDLNRLKGGVPESYRKALAGWFECSIDDFKERYPILPSKALQRFNLLCADPTREGAVYIGFNAPHDYNFTFAPGRVWSTSDYGKSWINTARLAASSWEQDSLYWQERGNPITANMTMGHQEQGRKKFECAIQHGNNYALRTVQGMSVSAEGHIMITAVHNTLLSTDHGMSWQQVDEDYTPNGNIMGRGNSDLPGETIMQDGRLDYTFLGAGEHSLFITTEDGEEGRTAVKYIDQVPNTVTAMATDPFDEQVVYATSFREHNKEFIFRSTDGGWNWEKHGRTTPISSKVWGEDMRTMSLLVNPIDNQTLYFGIGSFANFGSRHFDHIKKFDGQLSFYRSTDGGRSFTPCNKGIIHNARVRRILFDPRDPKRQSLFAGAVADKVLPPKTKGGLFYSNNNGDSWQQLTTPASVNSVYDMTFDHSNRLYIATGERNGGDGVWYSDDYGKSWTKTFEGKNAIAISVSPYDRNYLAVALYSGSKNPGIFLSRDRGATWYKINDRIATPNTLREVRFDINDASRMLLASCGTGFYIGDIKGGEDIQVVDIAQRGIKCSRGEQPRLTAKVVNRTFRNEAINWKSDNEAVVKVDKGGVLTPISRGVATVWATAVDGRYSDCCTVVVKQ